MSNVIPANDITLYDLVTGFNLRESDDRNFFHEWTSELPKLNELETAALDRIRQNYRHLRQVELLEPAVKMVVILPLLDLAGMYQEPFYFSAEKSVEIVSQDGEITVRGRLDALVFVPEFWVMAIEAKRTRYSLDAGIPQLLAYMLDAPHPDRSKPVFGWVTNGRDFQFIKLKLADDRNGKPEYALSSTFYMDDDNDLDRVLQILRKVTDLFREDRA